MHETIRRLTSEEFTSDDPSPETLEWLVTNGLGGYASGTVAGVATRRYHGLLIAALPAPLGRRLMLCHLAERVKLPDGRLIMLSGEERPPGDLHLYGLDYLTEFRLEMGLPVWRYEIAGVILERHIVLPHEQNTVFIMYRLLAGADAVRLKIMPSLHHRSHDAPVSAPLPGMIEVRECQSRYEFQIPGQQFPLRMYQEGRRPAFTIEQRMLPETLYPIEESRGYEGSGTLWTPGYFRVDITRNDSVALIASTESWEVITSLDAESALEAERERRRRLIAAASENSHESDFAAELVLAADQFVIRPVGRTEDAARVHAEGGEVRTIIAGYHWFTDWGRDTMISLEGLTLATGRFSQAGDILKLFAYYLRNGLVPNLFPEGEREGLYHTADATLWFFHALDRYVQITQDRTTLELLLPRLLEVAEHHLHGTQFGIGVDPKDGLLQQGAEGYQLTWMDAKVGDWVVTPRRGKAVEINALWYNALCLLAEWTQLLHDENTAAPWVEHARRARESFNGRFWYDTGGYLYDVVDGESGDDAACRPNQVFAISLKHPVAERRYWEPVLEVVRQRLLTPVGLRTLSPDHPDYRPRYSGDIRARDAAYHQGTVWPWLIGPFIDAWLKTHVNDEARVRQWLQGFNRHLNEACIGSVSEIFDAEPPYAPRGCIAQAWSVAELLRCWKKVTRKNPGENPQ